MKASERLLNYVRVHTTSDEASQTHPSTARQFDLARALADEMRALGLQSVRVSETGYVYGFIPATPGHENRPALGFIAHMDTSPNAPGENVAPRLIEDYDGGDVVLTPGGPDGKPIMLDTVRFPHLPGLKGRTLIVTDGRTLLGADDKAGIAEIMTACERLIQDGLPHGKVCIGFTPDEEVGQGAHFFDVEGFGADFAYTMDGGVEGELSYENFNAAEAEIVIQGVAVHPGTAKDVMVNALVVACELNGALPAAETPAHTEQYEGFYYLRRLTGSAERAEIAYSLRDHDARLLEGRKQTLLLAARTLNERYGAGTVTIELTDRYRNMHDIVRDHMHLIEFAQQAMARVGLQPLVAPMRGGTDGATLSYMGLPCPNLGTGGHAFHGVHEHITAEAMDQCVDLIVALVRLYAESGLTTARRT